MNIRPFNTTPRMQLVTRTLILAVALSGSLLVALQGGQADACNLLENPEFTTDLSSWDTTIPPAEGNWSWAAAGHSGPGSAHCDDPDFCTITQCVDVSSYSHPSSATYWISLGHAGQVGSLTLSAWLLPTTDCTGWGVIADTTEWFMPSGAWTSYQSSLTTVSNTQSILVVYTASYIFGGNPISLEVDDGGLCLASSESIFNNGFEDGTPNGWSSWVGY